MSDLRSKIIRLAAANPELRRALLPLLREAGRREDPNRVVFMVTKALTGPMIVNVTNHINKKYPYDGTPEGLASTLQEAASISLRFQSMDTLDGPEINMVRAPRVPSSLAQTVFTRTTVVVGAVYVALQGSSNGLRWEILPRAPKNASIEEEAKFEEGKPADPTEKMSPEDKKKWELENLKHKDQFKTASRSISEIARDIRKDWKKVNYAAVPYLEAMDDLDSIRDNYGSDSGRSIVLYFLNNARSWTGPTAKAIKAELQAILKGR